MAQPPAQSIFIYGHDVDSVDVGKLTAYQTMEWQLFSFLITLQQLEWLWLDFSIRKTLWQISQNTHEH